MLKYTDEEIIEYTLSWIKRFIIGHTICPFAKYSIDNQDFVIDVFHGDSPRDIMGSIYTFFDPIAADDRVSNAFLLLPSLHSFEALLDVKSIADDLFENIGWHHIVQLVVFHPEFRFANEPVDSNGNFVNRSPFPMLHFLKESAVTRATEHYKGIENIPNNNKQKLERMDRNYLELFLKRNKL